MAVDSRATWTLCGGGRLCRLPTILILLATVGSSVVGLNRPLDWRTKLTQDLFTNYEADILPLCVDYDRLVTATIDVALRGILDVDEPRQIITTTVWQRWKWTDCRLRWNITEYGSLDSLIVSANRIWIPDIIVFDSAEEFDGAQKTLAILDYTGEVFLLAPSIVKVACKIDIRYFPFDRQACRLMYVSSAYTGEELNLVNKSEHADLSLYVDNGEWDVVGVPAYRNERNYPCCTEPFPDITYYLVMERQSLYYIFNLVMPCMFITGISLLLFYLPPDSGEKISLGITVLLSLCVFLLMVSERMPASSETVPLIGQYFGATIILVSLSCAMTVVVLHIHHSGAHGRKVPRWLRKLTLDWLARALCMGTELYDPDTLEKMSTTGQAGHAMDHTSDYLLGKLPVANNHLAPRDVPPAPVGVLSSQSLAPLESLMERQLSTISSIDRLMRAQHSDSEVSSEWRKVATVVDRVLLLLMFVVITLVSMCVFLSRPTYKGLTAEDAVAALLNQDN